MLQIHDKICPRDGSMKESPWPGWNPLEGGVRKCFIEVVSFELRLER